jgi:hypothetical protein
VHRSQVAPKTPAKSFVLVNGVEGKSYDELHPDSLEPAHAHAFTYVALDGRRFMRVTKAGD